MLLCPPKLIRNRLLPLRAGLYSLSSGAFAAPRRLRPLTAALLAACLLGAPTPAAEPRQQAPVGDEIPLMVGRSVVLDHPDEIARVAITDDGIADAVAISTREVLINAKAPGATTLVIWSRSGDRNFFTINVNVDVGQLQDHIRATFPGESIRVLGSKGIITLTGNASEPAIAERVVAMAASLGGTVVDNLELPVPAAERQIILRVRFAEVQRSALNDFGVNLLSTGALNTPGIIGTQQFGGPSISGVQGTIGGPTSGFPTSISVGDVLNIFAFRPDLNLGAMLRYLQNNNLLEILAEPNIVTTSGKEAQLLVGGEFPVPVLQGGASAGAVTIQFRQFGIRIDFKPQMTARGSIQMTVVPEVSALDFANAVSFSGFLIPALSTRRVSTDVELMPGQSFVIAGLVDQRVTETVNKIPGLSSIPLVGKIFTSHSKTKNNTELLVLVTPEFPQPFEPGQPLPDIVRPVDTMPLLPEEFEHQKQHRRPEEQGPGVPVKP
jgi:pilus assembly protein CpaC